MIGPGTGVRVYLACGVTYMRKGIAGLAVLAQDVLHQKPASGAVFAFRGRGGIGSSCSIGMVRGFASTTRCLSADAFLGRVLRMGRYG